MIQNCDDNKKNEVALNVSAINIANYAHYNDFKKDDYPSFVKSKTIFSEEHLK